MKNRLNQIKLNRTGSWLAGVAMVGSLALTGLAQAHHSFAMFDNNKTVTLVGTIKEFQWTNPHVWIQVMVPDATGKEVEWSIEGGSTNILVRSGWRPKTIVPGDKVTLRMHPHKDGGPSGSFMDLTLVDGKVWSNNLPPAERDASRTTTN